MQYLRAPSQAGGSHHGAGGKLGQALRLQTNEGVANIFALQDAGQCQAIRQYRRHVLHRVYGDINAARQLGFVDFLGKQPLAANFRQGSIQHHIAGGFDDNDLDGPIGDQIGVSSP